MEWIRSPPCDHIRDDRKVIPKENGGKTNVAERSGILVYIIPFSLSQTPIMDARMSLNSIGRTFTLRSNICRCFCLWLLLATGSVFSQDGEFEILFNGQDLSGWKGIEKFWSVEDNAIVGQTTSENPTSGNTFLVWQGGELGDFDFRCKVRFSGNNSGVQYRSQVVDSGGFVLHGNQADLHPRQDYFGMLYGEGTRGIVATRGQRIEILTDGKTKIVGQVGDDTELTGDQWNDLRIVAVGNRLIHQVNGRTTVDITDNHPEAERTGVIGLQLHAGAPMKVEFRNLLIKRLSGEAGQQLVGSIDAIQRLVDSAAGKKASQMPNFIEGGEWLTEKPKARWIWKAKSTDEQQLWFRRSFNLDFKPVVSAIYATCDNEFTLWINGTRIASSSQWQDPIQQDVSRFLVVGKNVIAVEAQNHGGPAGFVFKLAMERAEGDGKGKIKSIQSHPSSWKMNERKLDGWNHVAFDDSGWPAAESTGTLGDGPWAIPKYTGTSGEGNPLDPKNIIAPPGFVVDHVYTVPQSQGSWVSMTTDPQGRIYACDQGAAGLYRLTIRENESPLVEKVSVDAMAQLSGAQGLLWAFDGLWFHRNGGHLYRLTDTDNDDQLDKMEEIPSTTGGGEHGNHALILTEDKLGIYVDSGNHSPMAQHTGSRVQSWDEDLLLPRMSDSNGHANGIMAPGGFVMRLDPETKTQTVHTIGFRNQYDITLNCHGDMFTYDADMEYDMGSPWYRPTRICHVVSGADYGWRNGSGKWPAYYEDSLPSVVDIGPGSPTGVVSGQGTHFPTRYQDAIFALDWTFGTIYSIHLKEAGAGYTGQAEPFVYSSPLPVTDAIVGHDGALYFAVGGRGTQSAVFRVRYIGNESLDAPSGGASTLRDQRRMLESFHGVADKRAIHAAWPMLSSPDRFMRHAARVAVESQPVEQWASRVFSESNPQARITGAVALARMGSQSHHDPLLDSLIQLNAAELETGPLLGLLRAYSLTFIRLGPPSARQRDRVVAQLDPLLPNTDDDANTELIRVLTYLRSRTVTGKAMKLIADRKPPVIPEWSKLASRNSNYGGTVESMMANHPPTRELGYAFILRNLREGWTIEQRRAYFSFLNEAAKAAGGASYARYLTRTREEALGNCSDAERVALEDITGEDFNPVPDFEVTKPIGPGRGWTVEEALRVVKGKSSFERGRSLFFGANCAQCHRVRGLGGNIGPDLTGIPNRFDQRYVMETIIHPSKHISDQYGSSIVALADGRLINGLVVPQDGGRVTIYPGEVGAEPILVSQDDIDEIRPSTVSQMPEKLLDSLNAEEINDLMGYLMSGGNANDNRFK